MFSHLLVIPLLVSNPCLFLSYRDIFLHHHFSCVFFKLYAILFNVCTNLDYLHTFSTHETLHIFIFLKLLSILYLLCFLSFLFSFPLHPFTILFTRAMYGSEAWCLNEGMIGVLRRTERSMVRAMCGVQHKDRKELAI